MLPESPHRLACAWLRVPEPAGGSRTIAASFAPTPSPAMPASAMPLTILQEVFGYPAFRGRSRRSSTT